MKMYGLPEVSYPRRTHRLWLASINVPLFLTSYAIEKHNLPYLEVQLKLNSTSQTTIPNNKFEEKNAIPIPKFFFGNLSEEFGGPW